MNKGVRELEPWEARMMREYRAGGWAQVELAWFFEVSQPVVSRVCRGESYKDAGGPVEQVRVRRLKASRLLLLRLRLGRESTLVSVRPYC